MPTTSVINLKGMAANNIDSDQYVDGSIDTVHIGDDQVTGAKLNPALVTGDIIYADGTDTINRLAKPGTPAGEVLTFATSATIPSWVAAAGGGKLLAMFHSTATFGSTTISASQNTWTDTAVTLTFTPTSTASKFIVYYGLGTSIQDAGTDGGFGRRIKAVQDGDTTYPTNLQDWTSGNLHSGFYANSATDTPARINWYYTFCGVDADAHTTNSLVYTVQMGQYNISTLNVGNIYAARSQIFVLEVSTA